MDFAQQQRKPAKHLMGIGIVILLHVGIVYALVSGLARKAVDAIREPLETTVIEEETPPPPPEELTPPPPPDFKAPPPPSFVPPPEVQVAQPAPTQTAITASTAEKPTSFQPAHTPAAPSAPPAPATKPSVVGLCANTNDMQEVMSDKWTKIAEDDQLTEYTASVEVVLGAGGEINDVRFKSASAASASMRRLIASSLKRLKCRGQGQEVVAQYSVHFNLQD